MVRYELEIPGQTGAGWFPDEALPTEARDAAHTDFATLADPPELAMDGVLLDPQRFPHPVEEFLPEDMLSIGVRILREGFVDELEVLWQREEFIPGGLAEVFRPAFRRDGVAGCRGPGPWYSGYCLVG